MASTKIYDLAVRTGTYTDKEGKEKGRYLNVGVILQKEDGGKFILLDRTFSPAGCPNPDNRPTVIISMFEPKYVQKASTAQEPPKKEEEIDWTS